MTDQERVAALADEINDELNELRGRFANRENDHFSFGLKFSSWDIIVRALRAYAEQGNAPSNEGNGATVPCSDDLREVAIAGAQGVDAMFSAMNAWAEVDHDHPHGWMVGMSGGVVDDYEAGYRRAVPCIVDAAISAISSARFVTVPREPTGAMIEAADAAIAADDPADWLRMSGPSRDFIVRHALRAALAAKVSS